MRNESDNDFGSFFDGASFLEENSNVGEVADPGDLALDDAVLLLDKPADDHAVSII